MKSILKNIHWIVWQLIIVIFAVHVYVFHNVAMFSWHIALQDATFSTLMFSLSTWGIVLLIRSYPTNVAIILYAFIISIVLSTMVAMTEWQVLSWWHGDDTGYLLWLHHSLPIRFIITFILNSWVATSVALRKRITTSEDRFQQQADASTLLREAELFKLRQQLQPHFLYNSLNSISALIMIEPDKAQEMIGKLSDFLRSSVRRESEDSIPINDELNYIQSYLAIESVRFGHRLQVNFDKQYTDDAVIPPFLLQPILENAIKFGVYGKTGDVVISICIKLEDSLLYITIINPYDAQTTPPKGTGFGLEGIKRRLYLLYGRTDLLETKSDEQYFTTILKIPQPDVQGDTDRR